MVRTGTVSSTVHSALIPQGSAAAQGLVQSPLIQASLDGHSESLIHPRGGGSENWKLFLILTFSTFARIETLNAMLSVNLPAVRQIPSSVLENPGGPVVITITI